MNRKTGVLFLAVLLVQAAAARAESVKDALNHKYKKQVLVLRTPITHGGEKFDSAGKPMNARPSDSWLIYHGAIYVEKLNVSQDTLRLEGPCVVTTNQKKKGKPVLAPLSIPVRIDIHLDHPLSSFDEAQAVLDHVFFLEGDAAERAWPEFRRADDNTPDDEIYHVSKHAFRRPDDNASEVAVDRDQEDKVLPPRPTYTPEPDFSEEARRARFQGTVLLKIVVNKTGDVVRVRLVRALGMGLDENAMEGVKRWRFSPATRNGQPVAVEMDIEVAFHLY